jgi:integrase
MLGMGVGFVSRWQVSTPTLKTIGKIMARRTKGEGSVFEYPAESGIYFAQITLPNGKQVKRKGPTAKEARAKLKELQSLAANEVNLGIRQPTLWQWWEIWLDQFALNLKQNMREEYRSIGRRYVQGQAIGRRKLIALTFVEVQAWVNGLAKRLAPKTVHNAHARLRTALDVAKRRGYIERNAADDIELPSIAHSGDDYVEMRPYSFGQAIALLECLQGNRWYALYRLAINIGARQGELLGLTDDSIDWTTGELTISHQLKRVTPTQAAKGAAKAWGLVPLKTKSAKRTIQLDDALLTVLRLHRKNRWCASTISGTRRRR